MKNDEFTPKKQPNLRGERAKKARKLTKRAEALKKSMTNKDASERNRMERNLMNKLCNFHN